MTIVALIATLAAGAQKTVVEEAIPVETSSATVRVWFDQIEQRGDIVLSYNPSQIDMNRRVYCSKTGQTTVDELLGMVLADYHYKLIPMAGRKILIQIEGIRLYDLTGTVREQGSNERLMGATVIVTDLSGHRRFAVTDHNGMFNVSVRRGMVSVAVSYVGYTPYERQVEVEGNRMVMLALTSIPFEVKAVQVNRRKSIEEMDEVAPSNMVAFSNSDLFSQIRILPGVSTASTNMNFTVTGGADDENLFLLEGIPVYNPGHINSMLPLFNGDAVKSVAFYNSFIPTQFEGRLSSVTDVRLREGNKQEYVNTLSLDMPSVSAALEGPIVKNKLSYLISGRHSWLDFFNGLVSDDDRMNHSFHDVNVKLSCDLDSVTNISLSAYNSVDNYHIPEDEKGEPMLRWNNQLYSLHFNTLISHKVWSATSLAYSNHAMRANAGDYLPDTVGSISNHIRSIYVNSEFTYTPGQLYTIRWGVKGVMEKYELTAFGMGLANAWEPTKQISIFFDNRVRLTPWVYAQVGLNYVRYMPRHSRSFNSVQPRVSLKWSLGNRHLLYMSMMRTEQFFHHIRMAEIATPFDFIMPSIEGFKPGRGTHVGVGWRHYTSHGVLELSTYYKHRSNVLALRPDVYIEDSNWSKYIMSGYGDSFGASLYYYDSWWRFKWQLSYTLSKSREWFGELKSRGKMPSANDVPHVLNGALSYEVGKSSLVTVGGNMHSGLIIYDAWDGEGDPVAAFRTQRDHTRYRIDASYSYRKELRHSQFLVRLGLYNIIGNPSDEDMFFFFSVQFRNQCVPYATVTFKF